MSKEPFAATPEDDTEDSLEEKEISVGIKEVKVGKQMLESEKEVSEKEEAQPSKALTFQDTISTTGDNILHDIIEEEETNVITSLKEEKKYKVWRPKRKPHLPDLVKSSKESHQKKSVPAVPQLDHSTSSISLLVRQQQLLDRVQATQAVLKESTNEILSPSPTTKKSRISFKEASQRVISDQKRQSSGHNSLSDIVTQYQEKIKRERELSQVPQTPKTPISARLPPWHSKRELTKQSSILGAIPIDKWQELVAENQASLGNDHDGDESEK